MMDTDAHPSGRTPKHLREEEGLNSDSNDINMSDLLADEFPSAHSDSHDSTDYSVAADQSHSKRRRVTVEDAPGRCSPDGSDADAGFDFIEDFPGEAGTPGKVEKTVFEKIRLTQETPWYPFTGHTEWELARWLMTSGVSQNNRESFLKLPIVRTCRQMCGHL
jgi:hypothetical protein